MILVIDNYDSFTYNLVDYIGKLNSLPVQVYRNDAISLTEIEELQPEFIIISPGPKKPKDAGISKEVIRRFGQYIPILGICLGHQAIAEEFGCEIVRATVPMHGKISKITFRPDPIFEGLTSPLEAIRYHSLAIDIAKISKEIVPLAFSIDDCEVMAIKHEIFPIYGLQFHPESIYTKDGIKLIDNFLKLGELWRADRYGKYKTS